MILITVLLTAVVAGYSLRDQCPSLYHFVFNDVPLSVPNVFLESFAVWAIVYGVLHLVFYTPPQRRFFHASKFNPRYPAAALIVKECLRSARGVGICCAYDVWVNQQARAGTLHVSWRLGPDSTRDVSSWTIGQALVLLYLFGDAHFYWTHRLLHTSVLYNRVHKVHHESYNPDGFSGLSMHPLESAIYFSAAPLIAPLVPLWTYRMMKIGLLLLPIEGHIGYGSKADAYGGQHHYQHHAYFNWNYGSSPLWDLVMGTAYSQRDRSAASARREAAARLQSEAVGQTLRAPKVR